MFVRCEHKGGQGSQSKRLLLSSVHDMRVNRSWRASNRIRDGHTALKLMF